MSSTDGRDFGASWYHHEIGQTLQYQDLANVGPSMDSPMEGIQYDEGGSEITEPHHVSALLRDGAGGSCQVLTDTLTRVVATRCTYPCTDGQLAR